MWKCAFGSSLNPAATRWMRTLWPRSPTRWLTSQKKSGSTLIRDARLFVQSWISTCNAYIYDYLIFEENEPNHRTLRNWILFFLKKILNYVKRGDSSMVYQSGRNGEPDPTNYSVLWPYVVVWSTPEHLLLMPVLWKPPEFFHICFMAEYSRELLCLWLSSNEISDVGTTSQSS